MEISKTSEFRKIQSIAKNQSFGITLPKKYAKALRIKKGDFVKIVNDSNRIIIEKVET